MTGVAAARGWLPGASARPRFFLADPRFLIGIGLMAASVIGVSLLVSAADRTVVRYVAVSPLAEGDRITLEDLAEADVSLGDAAERYLGEELLLAEGAVVTRPIAAGELVPVEALGSLSGITTARVVVDTDAQLSETIEPGSVVDLWSAQEAETGEFGPPTVLVAGATVVRILDDEGVMVGGDSTGVEVLVPRDEVALVLGASANADAIALVPRNDPLER